MEAPHGAKTFAAFLFLHFNWERWRDTGVLDAGGHDGENGGLGFRAIRRGTRLNFETITRAQKFLEKEGLITVTHYPYDPATGQKRANTYHATFPEALLRSSEQEALLRPCFDSLLRSSKQNLCLTSELNLCKKDTPLARSKGEFEERVGSVLPRMPSRPEAAEREPNSNQGEDESMPGRPYAEKDIEAVRAAIEDRGLTEIAAIVGYARGQGAWVSEKIIQSMCRDGLFPLLKENVA
jgi:hypothetical protein